VEGDLDFARDLGCKLVKCQSRHEADDTLRDSHSNGDEVGIAHRREIGKAVNPPAESLKNSTFDHSIKISGMDARCERLRGTERTSHCGKNLARFPIGWLFDLLDRYTSVYLYI